MELVGVQAFDTFWIELEKSLFFEIDNLLKLRNIDVEKHAGSIHELKENISNILCSENNKAWELAVDNDCANDYSINTKEVRNIFMKKYHTYLEMTGKAIRKMKEKEGM